MFGTYKVVYQLTIKHAYFQNGVCPDVTVSLTAESNRFLFRMQMIFKHIEENQWALLALDSTHCDSEWTELFTLQLVAASPVFWEYTDITCPQDRMILDELQVSLSNQVLKDVFAGRPLQADVFFQSKQAFWMYVLIPGAAETDKETERKIKLTDLSGQLVFERQEDIEVSGKTGQTFRTAEPVNLKDAYDYQLRLFEEKEYGDKLLKQWLDYPQPGAYYCKTEKEDKCPTLARYIYY